jgi:hypothetical protein
MDAVTNPQNYIDVAASICQEVVKDYDQAFVYGELDLKWLPEIRNSSLVVSLVKHATEDKHLKIVKLAEMFYASGFKEISVTDEDILTLVYNLAMAEGFDFSYCTSLSDMACDHLSKLSYVKAITLNFCPMITDTGVRFLASRADTLRVLSFEGLVQISDDSLGHIAKTCKRLSVINVNKCPNITYESLALLCQNNTQLTTFHASGTHINDEGLTRIASCMSPQAMTSIDISFCSDVSDYGVIALAEQCVALRNLNLAGLTRVSDRGTQIICANCW